MADTCKNCGKVIVFSNIGFCTTLYGLCKSCDRSMGVFDKMIYMNHRKEIDRKEERDRERDRNYEINERHDRIAARQEAQRQREAVQREKDKEFIDDMTNHEKMSEEDRDNCQKKEQHIINLAQTNGFKPHNFNYDNYCIVCWRHIEDIKDSECACVKKKKRD